MKAIPPTLRKRKRYILFEIISKSKIDYSELKKAIIEQFKKLFGEIGLAKSNVKLLKWNGKKGIIMIWHKSVPDLKYSIMSINRINRKKIIFKTIKVFGTIKKAKKNMEVC